MVLIHRHSSKNNDDKYIFEAAQNSLMDISQQDPVKKAAAFACAEENIENGMRLGIGSGSTIKYLILWLKQKCENGTLTNIQCVPTSFQSRQWLHEAGLPINSLETLNSLDLTIDGADEIDHNLTCIKGGGGCLLQEKIVQTCAQNFILIGNMEKYVEFLGEKQKSVPIEVVQFGWAPVKRWITEKLGGECVLRMDKRKCFPSVTENHNYIFDWYFPEMAQRNWGEIHQTLINITGVVETGLFVGVAKKAYLADKDAKISTILPK